jgi:hypothetical protein
MTLAGLCGDVVNAVIRGVRVPLSDNRIVIAKIDLPQSRLASAF